MSHLAVSIEHLDFSFGSHPVLSAVNVSIENRSFASIVGPNGGGKTTLLKLMLGLLKPQQGLLRIFGQPPETGRRWIGYLPQQAAWDAAFPVTALDVVLMGKLRKAYGCGFYSRQDRTAAYQFLERVGLHGLHNRALVELSGGQRQRVLIARALATQPRMLLLDEPSSNLDGFVEWEIYELLKELNREMTIIVVSHDIGHVSRYVEKVICVNREVHIHPTSEINENIIHSMYGGHAHAVRHDQKYGHG